MKPYRIVNYVILALLFYILVFPFISTLLTRLSPELTQCYHKANTGELCPFCGLTRDMNCLLTGDEETDRINTNFQIFLSMYALEWFVRLLITILSRKFTGRTIPIIDIGFHLIMVIVLFNTLKPI